ncbi:MAG: beta-lactamase family protein [Streptomyces sp.]|nr:beta-lactamase family protein [Streptomyces sp.]
MPARRWAACAAVVATALVVSLPVAAGPATARGTVGQEAPAALQRDLDAVVSGGPTGALVEVRDGAGTVHATAGTAVAGTAAPVDPAGRFRAGSVTKAFTATVVLQLVAEHRLGLDETVGRRLPGLLPGGDRITVRELLGHTSGLYDYTRTLPLSPPSAFLPIRYRTWTPGELVARATAQPAGFPPGTSYRYSDTDYLVLGMLVEQVTGRPYAEEVTRRIIRPLGLAHTSLPGTDPRIPGPHARAYIPDGAGGVIDITELNPSVMGSAGEVISSAADLDRFTTALLGGRLLPPRQLAQMTTVAAPSQTGLGLETLALPCGRTAYGHDGDVPGASTWAFATTDGHAVTLSVTWGTNRPAKPAVTALLDDALCAA